MINEFEFKTLKQIESHKLSESFFNYSIKLFSKFNQIYQEKSISTILFGQ